jgi:hypothetical protein
VPHNPDQPDHGTAHDTFCHLKPYPDYPDDVYDVYEMPDLGHHLYPLPITDPALDTAALGPVAA